MPTDGGQWALQLVPGWIPEEGFAETAVTGISGTHTFTFSCKTKAVNWRGHIVLSKKQIDGTTLELAKISFDNKDWETLSLSINTTMNATDILIVHLSAGVTEVAYGKVYFDNVTLETDK